MQFCLFHYKDDVEALGMAEKRFPGILPVFEVRGGSGGRCDWGI